MSGANGSVGRRPYAWAVLVRVEVEPCEDGLVEYAPALLAGEPVELLRLREEHEQHAQRHTPCIKAAPLGLIELPL
jgi:hypothetical protein